MNRLSIVLFTSFVLAGCFERPAMTMIEIRSESDEVKSVEEVFGIGFGPYDNPLKPTNAAIPGPVSKFRAGHGEWTRIVVHDQIAFSLQDRSGQLHTPKVTILGKVPGKKDYGQVDIVIKSPEEVVVTVGERPANPR